MADQDELRKKIDSAFHRLRTRALRDAPIYLQHVVDAQNDVAALLTTHTEKAVSGEKIMRETYLDVIDSYYIRNRQVGHTYAVILGAIDPHDVKYGPERKPIILVGNNDQIKNIKRFDPNAIVVSMGSPRRLKERLAGEKRPLVVDNVAWYYIAADARDAAAEAKRGGGGWIDHGNS